MSSIIVETDAVCSLTDGLKHDLIKLSNNTRDLSSIRHGIDSRIMARRNIRSRMSNAYSLSCGLEKKLQALSSFVDKSISDYCRAENTLAGKASSIEHKAAGAVNGLFGGITFDDVFKGIKNTVGLMNAASILDTKSGLSFDFFRKDGKIFLKVIGDKVKNQKDYLDYRNLLKKDLGGRWKWDRNTVTKLVDDGIELYDEDAKKFINSNINKFKDTEFSNLNKYIKRIGKGKLEVAGSTFKNTFTDNMKVWKNFTGWKDATTLTKAGKALGILGTGLTVYKNARDNLIDKDTGKWDVTGDNAREFVVDTAVDISASAAASAAGAAVGSFFLPPVGTVVGAGVGMAVGSVMTECKFGQPPASLVDHTKNFANWAVDGIGDCATGIGKSLGKIFW